MSASHYHHYRYSEEAGCSPCDRGADGMLSGAGTQQQFGRERRGQGEKSTVHKLKWGQKFKISRFK